MRTTLLAGALALLALAAGPVLAQDKVELQVVKYTDLGKAIKERQGKVVVMDLWADW